MSKAKKAKQSIPLKDGMAGDIIDKVMDIVSTIQLGWKATPRLLQEELEGKLQEAINESVANTWRLFVMQDIPSLIADLESVKTKKGKTVVTLTIATPDVNGTLSELNYKARQGGEVIILFADPKDYVHGVGTSRAEDDQKSLFMDDSPDES